MLAVVQHEEQLPVGEERPQSVLHLASRYARRSQSPSGLILKRAEDRVGEQRRYAEGSEVHPPDPVDRVGDQLSGGLQGETGLSDPTRPGERDHTGGPQKRQHLADIAVPADEGGHRRRQVAPAPADEPDVPPGRRWGQLRVVNEDLLVDAAQLRSRIDAQLVGEHATRRLVQVQRVGLAAARVQGAHQLRNQPLPERILRDQAFQLDHDSAVLAAKQVRLDPVLHRRQPPLRKVDGGGLPERQIRHVAQRRPPPQAQRPPQGVGRRRPDPRRPTAAGPTRPTARTE